MKKHISGTLSLKRPRRESEPAQRPSRQPSTRWLWLWFGIMLITALLILGVVSTHISSWAVALPLPTTTQTKPPTIATLTVQRTSSYAGLTITVVNAQYATSFVDDDIRPDAALVRLNLHVANATKGQINIVYYAIARLLSPTHSPIAPSNVHLSVGPLPAQSENGWLDFPVPAHLALNSLTLQLGSPALHEMLVNIPFTGPFNTHRYVDRTIPATLTMTYSYFGHTLIYHLSSIDMRYAYQGTPCQSGKQFYVLHFLVDNPESGDLSPGYGFDYLRLVFDGNNLPPIDNSLPYTFKAGAQNVSGDVVFSAQAGLTSLTIGLLSQNGNGQQNSTINL